MGSDYIVIDLCSEDGEERVCIKGGKVAVEEEEQGGSEGGISPSKLK